MNVYDDIAVLALAWTVVQITRATYAYRASQRAADRRAEKEKADGRP